MPMFNHLKTAEEIAGHFKSLRSEPIVALDFEASSLFTYKEKICLAQVSTESEGKTNTAIIDALASPQALEELGPILANPHIEKIFHGGDYDVRLLKKEYSFDVRNIFDTMTASQLAGREKVGLAALLEEHFQVNTDKKHQRSDWTARPLSAEQLAYAALDTEYLIKLKRILESELIALGRMSWAKEEFKLLEGITPTERKQPWCRDVKGSKGFSVRELSRLQALLEMRELVAMDWDRPPFKVISNAALLAWAENPPSNRKEIEDAPVGSKVKKNLYVKILDAVNKTNDISEDVRFKNNQKTAYAPMDGNQEKRFKLLKKARVEVSEKLRIDPGLIVNSATLEQLARKEPDEVVNEMKLRLKSWQIEAIGDSLKEALK